MAFVLRSSHRTSISSKKSTWLPNWCSQTSIKSSFRRNTCPQITSKCSYIKSCAASSIYTRPRSCIGTSSRETCSLIPTVCSKFVITDSQGKKTGARRTFFRNLYFQMHFVRRRRTEGSVAEDESERLKFQNAKNNSDKQAGRICLQWFRNDF